MSEQPARYVVVPAPQALPVRPAPVVRPRRSKAMLWSALRLFAAAADLRRGGAVVRALRLLPEPAIVIDVPPPGLLGTYAVTYAADRQARPTLGCARARNGVPILWTPIPLSRGPRATPPLTPRSR